jgi:hypothetical protein
MSIKLKQVKTEQRLKKKEIIEVEQNVKYYL